MPYFGTPIRNGLPIGLGSVAGFGAFQFSPSVLFAAGEQGAWYDPSDYGPTGTLFQDAAGTTPTVMETRVRLMLDKSKGLVLGSELVTNGDFSSSSGWTLPGTGTNSITGGQAVLSGAAGYLFRTGTSITAARWYRVSFTVSGYSGSGTVRPYIQASPVFGSNVTGNGVFVQYLLATTTSANTEIGLNFASFTGNVDDLSIKQVAGNHATAPSDASSPILRARYNLLQYSEDLGNAYWAKDGVTVSGNAIAIVSNSSFKGLDRQLALTTGVSYRIRFSLRAGTVTQAQFWFGGGANVSTATTVISGPGSISAAGADNVNLSNLSATVETVYEIRWTEQIGTHGIKWYPGDWASQTAGDSLLLSFPDLRTSSDAALNIPAYQSITTATSYDTAGFPPYLAFDGTDDSFSTASVDFTGTDEMTVWAGVTKLSDATQGAVVELTTDPTSVAGSFAINGPGSAGAANYLFRSAGTAFASVNGGVTVAAPITNIVGLVADISADQLTARVNGVTTNFSGANQGSGNYANAAVFIGRRNDTSIPLNGRIYSLIIRGAATTTPLIASTDQWVAGKMRLPI